jgi:hypothetical protein
MALIYRLSNLRAITPTSPFNLVLSFDSSVGSAPAAFTTACLGVANLFMTLIRTPATVTIQVGYGEAGGNTLGGGVLGETVNTLINTYTYTQVRNAYLAKVSGPDMTTAANQLPATDPTGGGQMLLLSSQWKALGLATHNGPDAACGFATSGFDYGGGPSISGFDFCGVVAHEFSEVLGRQTNCGANFLGSPGYFLLDLFRYSSAGTRNLGAASTAGYFSMDGGTTDLRDFNTGAGDSGDWSGAQGSDSANASASSNVTAPFSNPDQQNIAVCGWQTNGPISWNTSGL